MELCLVGLPPHHAAVQVAAVVAAAFKAPAHQTGPPGVQVDSRAVVEAVVAAELPTPSEADREDQEVLAVPGSESSTTGSAVLYAESLPQFAPRTNQYNCGDHYLLVTVPAADIPVPAGLLPTIGSMKVGEIVCGPTAVFLCDENAQVLDADGDPTNGLTPIATFPPGTTHEDALAALGYVVT